MERDPPVEAVAAEVDEAPAAVAIGLQGIEGFGGMVFRVARGQDRAVSGKRLDAFAVDLVIGHQVERAALIFEPGQQVQIGLKVPLAGAAGVDDREVAERKVSSGRSREAWQIPLPSLW